MMKIPTIKQLVEIMNTAQFKITCMKKQGDCYVLETTKLEKDLDGMIYAMAKAVKGYLTSIAD